MFKSFHILYILAAFLLPAYIFSASPAFAQPTEKILIWSKNWGSKELLSFILDKSVDKFGSYTLVQSTDLEEGRALHELQYGNCVDLLSVPATIERHKNLRPINLPLNNEPLGIRVLLIPKGTQELFNGIRSLEDLRTAGLRFGSGMHWADTTILRDSGLEVVTNPKRKNLYRMLAHTRFDAFPRGILEYQRQLDNLGDPEITDSIEVEKHLLLAYPFSNVFYVSPNNIRLAQRIEMGFAKALQDGSWHAWTADFRERLKRELDKHIHRTVIWLENPSLPQEIYNIEFMYEQSHPQFHPPRK